VDEREGTGTVLAARSGVPFRFTLLASGDDWDYAGALLLQPTGGDALAALLDIVERLADEGRAEVDVTTYAVNSPKGALSLAAAGATTDPTTVWPSTRSSPYPGAGGDQAPDREESYGDSTATTPIIITAVCASSYVAEGAVCGSVSYNPTFIQSETENQPYPDTYPAGGYYPYYDPYFFFLFSHRVRTIERPAPPPPPRPAQTLPRPPRPSRVRVIKPALPQYPPLPPPRRPMPVAAAGARIRAPGSDDVARMAAARPPMTSVSRPMPAAWTRRRPATAAGAAAIAVPAAVAAPVVRRPAGSPSVAPGVSPLPASRGTTHHRAAAAGRADARAAARDRTSTQRGTESGTQRHSAYPHPIPIIRPRTP
jgi:hypothetical protein